MDRRAGATAQGLPVVGWMACVLLGPIDASTIGWLPAGRCPFISVVDNVGCGAGEPPVHWSTVVERQGLLRRATGVHENSARSDACAVSLTRAPATGSRLTLLYCGARTLTAMAFFPVCGLGTRMLVTAQGYRYSCCCRWLSGNQLEVRGRGRPLPDDLKPRVHRHRRERRRDTSRRRENVIAGERRRLASIRSRGAFPAGTVGGSWLFYQAARRPKMPTGRSSRWRTLGVCAVEAVTFYFPCVGRSAAVPWKLDADVVVLRTRANHEGKRCAGGGRPSPAGVTYRPYRAGSRGAQHRQLVRAGTLV
ncbi:hypothetical protein OH77DRAFT_1107737 [Trametes cingulata]|nr:hypothetical protein OH77DRAFT_1107737 [Trametes cingulata]